MRGLKRKSSRSRPRLAFLASHPIQYQAPLFRALTTSGRLDLEVLFLSDFGVEPTFDPGFGREIQFDVPLVEGFAHRFLPNYGLRVIDPSLSLINPSLVKHLRSSRIDGVVVQGYAHISDWIAFASVATTDARLLLRGETLEPSAPAAVSRHWRLKRRLLAPVIRRTDACLAIGHRNAAFYRCVGARANQVVSAPYSVDNEHFARGGANGRRSRARKLSGLGLDPQLPTVLFAGKLIRRKRVLDLVAAMDRLDGAASLVIIGDGEQRRDVASLAGDRPWMRALGFVNQVDLATWYGACDIVVLPSDHETWGLTINEAMAAGAVPVVSDAVGCAPDLVNGGAGRVFPVGDIEALARSLEGLLDLSVRDAARLKSLHRIERYGLSATVAGIEMAMLRPRQL